MNQTHCKGRVHRRNNMKDLLLEGRDVATHKSPRMFHEQKKTLVDLKFNRRSKNLFC
jgi:hypothetical protein